MIILIIAIVVNVILANLIAKQGEDRKIGYTNSFLVSLLLTPLIGLLLVIASMPLSNEEKEIKKREDKFFFGYRIPNKNEDFEPKNFPGIFILILLIIFFLLIIGETRIYG